MARVVRNFNINLLVKGFIFDPELGWRGVKAVIVKSGLEYLACICSL
jgi:hypothetical protein